MDCHVLYPRPGGLDLAATLGCGQAFRWSPTGDGAWEGVIGAHAVRAWKEDEALHCETDLGAGALARYFRLDDDLEAVYATFPPDPEIQEAVRRYRGLRLLRQDPWECLVSFICAQNSNIPRIRKMIEALCEGCGDRLAGGRKAWPTARALAAPPVEQVTTLRLGYRAEWLQQAARCVAEGWLDLNALQSLDTASLLEALQELQGVGPKVAACVALFAYHRLDVVPVDVWIRRAIEARKPGLKSNRARAEFAREWLGPYAGYAQQYLFHYRRAQAGAPC